MSDVDVDGVGSGSGFRARVRIACSVRCLGSIGLWLELSSHSAVTARARLKFTVTVRLG